MSRLDVRERTLLEIEIAVLDGLSNEEATKQELIKELLAIINKYYE
tara:strand:+ start:27 stop:164 length:138 start_codon:yes stop_codon:yes gene_type:complete